MRNKNCPCANAQGQRACQKVFLTSSQTRTAVLGSRLNRLHPAARISVAAQAAAHRPHPRPYQPAAASATTRQYSSRQASARQRMPHKRRCGYRGKTARSAPAQAFSPVCPLTSRQSASSAASSMDASIRSTLSSADVPRSSYTPACSPLAIKRSAVT